MRVSPLRWLLLRPSAAATALASEAAAGLGVQWRRGLVSEARESAGGDSEMVDLNRRRHSLSYGDRQKGSSRTSEWRKRPPGSTSSSDHWVLSMPMETLATDAELQEKWKRIVLGPDVYRSPSDQTSRPSSMDAASSTPKSKDDDGDESDDEDEEGREEREDEEEDKAIGLKSDKDVLVNDATIREQLLGQRMRQLPKGFRVKVLDINRSFKVTKAGGYSKFSALVAVGNGKGVGYWGFGKAPTVRLAIGRAQRRALRGVHFYPFYDDRTIFSSSEAKFKRTAVHIHPALPGHGVHIHPKLRMICRLLGLQDLHSKVHGARNIANTVKAFFRAMDTVATPFSVARRRGVVLVDSRLRSDRPVVAS